MHDIGWQFPAVLFGALMLTALLSMLQIRQYNRELQAALKASTGAHDALLSGRFRSFRGGSIVVLLVDQSTREITRARAMTGLTVLARFTDRPELLGPVDSAPERARGRALRDGVAHALLQMPRPHRTLDDTSARTIGRTSPKTGRNSARRTLATR